MKAFKERAPDPPDQRTEVVAELFHPFIPSSSPQGVELLDEGAGETLQILF
ncbi:MAG: hypothetical protein H7836_02000 [Magnetococcus sp. YQC-3]